MLRYKRIALYAYGYADIISQMPFKRIFYALAGTRAAAVNTVCIKRERQAYAKPARSSLAVYAVNAADLREAENYLLNL